MQRRRQRRQPGRRVCPFGRPVLSGKRRDVHWSPGLARLSEEHVLELGRSSRLTHRRLQGGDPRGAGSSGQMPVMDHALSLHRIAAHDECHHAVPIPPSPSRPPDRPPSSHRRGWRPQSANSPRVPRAGPPARRCPATARQRLRYHGPASRAHPRGFARFCSRIDPHSAMIVATVHDMAAFPARPHRTGNGFGHPAVPIGVSCPPRGGDLAGVDATSSWAMGFMSGRPTGPSRPHFRLVFRPMMRISSSSDHERPVHAGHQPRGCLRHGHRHVVGLLPRGSEPFEQRVDLRDLLLHLANECPRWSSEAPTAAVPNCRIASASAARSRIDDRIRATSRSNSSAVSRTCAASSALHCVASASRWCTVSPDQPSCRARFAPSPGARIAAMTPSPIPHAPGVGGQCRRSATP